MVSGFGAVVGGLLGSDSLREFKGDVGAVGGVFVAGVGISEGLVLNWL